MSLPLRSFNVNNNNLVAAPSPDILGIDFLEQEFANPRAHTRSRSWSYRCSTIADNQSSGTMSSLFSPIRVFQGIVPSLNSVSSTNTAATGGPAGGLQRLPSSPSRIAHVRTRSEASRGHSRQSSAVEIDLSAVDENSVPPTPDDSSNSNGQNQSQMEFLGTISWLEKAAPFVLLLLSRIMWDHRLGILVFIGLFGTFFHVNSTLKKQVALKERRLNSISIGIFLFLFANIAFIYYAFRYQQLEKCLIWCSPVFYHVEMWTVFWCVGITDFVVRFVTMAVKCVIIVLPRWLINFRKRGKYFLVIENISQLYRMSIPIPQWYKYFSNYGFGGEYFAVLSTCVYIVLKMRMLFLKAREVQSAFVCFWKDIRYGRTPKKEQVAEDGNSCPICQEELVDPIELNACKHIFCEDCIVMWFDRERTCPMCRAKVADDPQWRDGSTQSFIQLF